MSVNKLLKLPSRVTGAREALGISQKALASSLGVHPTHLCGIEKGRRRVSHPDFLEQLADALKLSAGDLSDLHWALAHDQVIEQAKASGFVEVALQCLSTTLQLEHELSQDEFDGLRLELEEALRSKRKLRPYAARASRHEEGRAMP